MAAFGYHKVASISRLWLRTEGSHNWMSESGRNLLKLITIEWHVLCSVVSRRCNSSSTGIWHRATCTGFRGILCITKRTTTHVNKKGREQFDGLRNKIRMHEGVLSYVCWRQTIRYQFYRLWQHQWLTHNHDYSVSQIGIPTRSH